MSGDDAAIGLFVSCPVSIGLCTERRGVMRGKVYLARYGAKVVPVIILQVISKERILVDRDTGWSDV